MGVFISIFFKKKSDYKTYILYIAEKVENNFFKNFNYFKNLSKYMKSNFLIKK